MLCVDRYRSDTPMKTGTNWVVVDTETAGLYEPIHIVELSAQLMKGWEPQGEPFRMLLNHNVPIPPEAVAIHGYTQEYLRRNGHEPRRVHSAFREYASDYPLVAHNLSYDWNRCLEPEWGRLGVPQIGQRGFCCMMLARRLVPEVSSYRLEALKQCFQLTPSQGHRAEHDVRTVVELFQRVYRYRLEPTGLDTYESDSGVRCKAYAGRRNAWIKFDRSLRLRRLLLCRRTSGITSTPITTLTVLCQHVKPARLRALMASTCGGRE